ncbi:MAG: EscU/YscU/HrcU family type III secretion system export apparatus switch protein, partial [Pseudomonadota bacterium]
AVFFWLLLQQTLASSLCSIGCVLDSASNLGLLLIITAVLMLVAAGLIDLPLQQQLFRHEQKMGHKELKRELKDTQGSPEFKSHRRNEYRKLAGGGEVHGDGAGSGVVGGVGPGAGKGAGGAGSAEDASKPIAIIRGADSAVGIYFHPSQADVPIVVMKLTGKSFLNRIRDFENAGIPIEYDQALLKDMIKSVDIGHVIRERQFEKVAKILIRTGALG